MLESCCPIQRVIDILLNRFCHEYELDILTARDWIILRELCNLLRHFEPLSRFLEGEQFVTVPEYLGRLALVCAQVFYTDIGNDETLDGAVREVKKVLRQDFGRRLWESSNEMTMAGLALHPK